MAAIALCAVSSFAQEAKPDKKQEKKAERRSHKEARLERAEHKKKPSKSLDQLLKEGDKEEKIDRKTAK